MKIELIQKIKEMSPLQLIFPFVIFVIFLGTIIGIVRYQNANKQNKTPIIEVTTPADGAVVDVSQVVVQGKTTPGNTVSLGGKNLELDRKGNFKTEAPLSYGENRILITVKNKSGIATEKILRVDRKGQPAPVSQPNTKETTVGKSQNESLSKSGPENFWIPEALLISAVGAAWVMSRKKLENTINQ